MVSYHQFDHGGDRFRRRMLFQEKRAEKAT